jgi:hypothetical protein
MITGEPHRLNPPIAKSREYCVRSSAAAKICISFDGTVHGGIVEENWSSVHSCLRGLVVAGFLTPVAFWGAWEAADWSMGVS